MLGLPQLPTVVPFLPSAGVALAVALSLFLLGQTCRPRPPGDILAWERHVSALLADSAATHQRAALLAEQARQATLKADTLERAVVRWEARAETHRQSAQTARHALATAQTAADSLPAAIAALEATERVVVSLRVALDSSMAATGRLREATRLATVRGDSLDTRVRALENVLGQRPTGDRCKVLWMDCPSRLTSTVLGVAAGVVGSVLVLR